ncbi:hypothetical protein [Halobacterium yunchengense]|uniref:hypothetical protein n=1 Tax=Halobacterium yunchengense TaxID=3108497 RepID=UPI00300AA0F8
MPCPYLEYRASDDDHDFDHERPYCEAAGEFVSPMKADICNDRHEFDHAEDCDVYRAAAEDAAVTPEPTD